MIDLTILGWTCTNNVNSTENPFLISASANVTCTARFRTIVVEIDMPVTGGAIRLE